MTEFKLYSHVELIEDFTKELYALTPNHPTPEPVTLPSGTRGIVLENSSSLMIGLSDTLTTKVPLSYVFIPETNLKLVAEEPAADRREKALRYFGRELYNALFDQEAGMSHENILIHIEAVRSIWNPEHLSFLDKCVSVINQIQELGNDLGDLETNGVLPNLW